MAPQPRAVVPFACPACKSALAESDSAYACPACAKEFPIVLGIPDFRLRADPYIGIEEDREKGLRIAREAAGRDLRGLLEFYWSITPEVEPARAERFIQTVLASRGRGEDILDWLGGFSGGPILEIGCGAGGFLSAAAGRGAPIVGVDRAFRWLVIARLALERDGIQAQLACADARELPFAESSFGLAIADGVIEHTDSQQEKLVREAARVLHPAGVFFASTPNRCAPLPDPHYGVPLLGWLPRGAMPAAVRVWRGKEYRHIRLLGARELKSLFRDAGLDQVRAAPAAFGPKSISRFSGIKKILLGVYSSLRRFPPTRALLTLIGPVIWCVGKKPGRADQ